VHFITLPHFKRAFEPSLPFERAFEPSPHFEYGSVFSNPTSF
jgi:hypothetical protein